MNVNQKPDGPGGLAELLAVGCATVILLLISTPIGWLVLFLLACAIDAWTGSHVKNYFKK